MLKKFTLIRGFCLVSFFVGCKNSSDDNVCKKKPDLYKASPLAALMDTMHKDNLIFKKQIENGQVPDSVPKYFYKIHTAEATAGMIDNKVVFSNLSDEYLHNMEAIAAAKDTAEAKVAYNQMINTCASCHQVYCQGPLSMIHRMTIK